MELRNAICRHSGTPDPLILISRGTRPNAASSLVLFKHDMKAGMKHGKAQSTSNRRPE